MSKPAKYLRLDKAIDLLHHRDSRLMRMHSADSLFPGLDQTYRLVR